jgi:hypothetical protein
MLVCLEKPFTPDCSIDGKESGDEQNHFLGFLSLTLLPSQFCVVQNSNAWLKLAQKQLNLLITKSITKDIILP